MICNFKTNYDHVKITIKIFFTLFLSLTASLSFSQAGADKNSCHPGAEQVSEYLPLIKGKTIAIVANQTSMIRKTHLVDSLVSLQVK